MEHFDLHFNKKEVVESRVKLSLQNLFAKVAMPDYQNYLKNSSQPLAYMVIDKHFDNFFINYLITYFQ